MRFLFAVWMTLVTLSCPLPCRAGEEDLVIIRDAEIEHFILDILHHLFQAAGMGNQKPRVFLINDKNINAAASLNASIFINTGLITHIKTVDELVGVLAHETGHIAGGHVLKTQDSLNKASLMALAAAALGGAAMLAGQGELGTGLLLGGQSSALGTFLHYSRGQEASADQAALRFLDKLGWSSQGLLSFMQYLSKQEMFSAARQDPYLLTHPLSQERVSLMSNHPMRPSNFSAIPDLPERFKRIQAKVIAFMQSAMATRLKFPEKNTDFATRYARAIAFYKDKKYSQALAAVDTLLQTYPQDPYLHELKGQISFEYGQVDAAIQAYEKALALKPKAALIRIALVQARLEKPTVNLQEQIKSLQAVMETERENPQVWQLLAIAYGRQGNLALTALSLAEKALTLDDFTQARAQATRATQLLKSGPALLRARDILQFAEKKETRND
jgi:predicted Zn-dependent protease